MKVGYARVSTQDQQLHLQVDALQAAGCTDIIQEKASFSKDRPPLLLLTRLRAGDTLVVWKLDRLGRSLKDLVMLVTGFQPLREPARPPRHHHGPGPAHV
jgi:DNA invertase Pin-like site-specific DNA recombinase